MDSKHAASHSANQRSPLAKASGGINKGSGATSKSTATSSRGIGASSKVGEMPNKGAGSPSKGTPISGKGTLVSGKGTSISGKGTPLSGKGTPMSGKGTPMSGKGTPMSGKGTPVHNKGASLPGKESPVFGKGAPVPGKGSPILGRGAGTTSKATGAMAKSTGAVAKPTGAVTKSTGAVTKSTGAVTKSTGAVSKSTGAISKATGSMSKATGSMSKATGSMSKTTGGMNKAAGAMSKVSPSDGGRLKGVQIVKPIIYGNVAWYLGSKRDNDGHTHQWKVYLKAYNNEDLSVYIKRVHFKLHESYEEPNRICYSPPYGVTETGWGEFEIAMKIFFQDSNERPVVIYHFLKLFDREKDGNVRVMSAPVHSEFYDEMIFTDPTAKMYRLLTHPRVNPHGSPSHRINYENKKVTDLQKIIDAKDKVRQEIAELKDRLATAKDSIQLLKSQGII